MATASSSLTLILQHSSPTSFFSSIPPCFSVKNHNYNNYTTHMPIMHHQQQQQSSTFKNKNKKKTFSICSRTRKNKIFEDQPKGIICFRDELTGEITCEGYDEGPRSPPNPNYHQRDAAEEIIDLLLIHNTCHQLVINGMPDQTQTVFPNHHHHHDFTHWDN